MANVRQIGDFKINPAAWNKAKQVIPKVIANEAVNHFKLGFRGNKQGGQTDASQGGWDTLSERYKRKKAAVRGGAGSILVNEGTLRRSIERIKATFRSIIVGTVGVEYARRHNEGLKGMPKREFIGDSKALNKKIRRIILTETGLIFGKRGIR